MDFIMADVLSGELVPVLLGISPEVSETAHRMYRQYGVVSHVFCDKIPLAMRLSLCMKFHVIRRTTDQRLLIQALNDFAEQLGNADVILYLIPCTEEYAGMVWRECEALESRFVIADKAEMYRVWFGEEMPVPKRKEEPI
ncbi:MAG: hypothetical protein IJX13_08665 [Clostridia bacterium]|nr:hypothetical protein [Clostridia bacterium]